MKIMTSLVAGVFVGLAISSAFAADQNPMVMQKIDLMPLAFTQNNGQWDQPVFAQIDAGRDQGETAGRSIREFLTPEGRFDLEAARRSGYQGPLDMRGFETALDTSTGQPVFRAASPASPTDNPDDIYWDNSISPSFPGMNDFVRRLTVYDGKLIAAGNFAIAGGVAANYIASWDGSSWSSLGSGMNEWVYDLTVYDGKLIAGGLFTIAGGVAANYIASWDGSSWSPLGLGMNGIVIALTVYDGRLIAGGDFTSAGGVAANYIASWDGSSWSPLGSGMNGDVFTVTVYKGHLIAGGNFLIAGNKVSAYLAAWTLILDADSDGVADVVDNCTEVYNPDQTDTDHDGIGDACDLCTDTDHDGFGNPGFAVNTCPTDNCPNIFNPDQMDADGDGIGAECDNCPFAYDPNQEDADHDGKGDSCDVGAVAFTASPRCGGAPLTVAFTDQSAPIHTATSWLWDFGDGHSGTGQNLSHEYNDVGVFDVMLIVSNGSLGDTLIKSGYITTQVGLTADFTGIPNSGKSPLTVVFEPILQGIANEYLWDFGDGETSTVRNPIHTYAVQGMYDVKLIARLIQDGCDQVDTITKEGYVVVNDLIPAFRATPLAGVEPLTVQFTDESQGSPLQFYWEFGDGQSSTDQNPVHQYVSEGTFDVFLRVTNIIGADSLKKLSYIHVDSAYADLSGEIYDNGVRPGFDLHFYSVWINTGTLPADNCVLKILPPEEITLYGVSPGQILTGTYFGYTMSGDTIVINLGTNNPTGWYGGGGYVDIYGNLPPSVPVGHILTCRSWLTTTTPEKQLANNNVQHSLIVRGSIDPNDKLCSPEGTGLEKKIAPDQRLSYMIRFENKPEATAEAIYIRVVDTLDHNLDWSTLAFGAMSHPDKCKYEFDPYAGVIDCFCDSIMLPPNVSKPEGEGYFTYSISPKKDLPAGTEVSNTAWIRFDYNAWLQAPEAGAVIRTIWQSFMCGDANGDRTVNIGDAVYVINYIFKGGPQPTPLKDAGDANCDHAVNVGDAVYVINYIFKGGPAPCCP